MARSLAHYFASVDGYEEKYVPVDIVSVNNHHFTVRLGEKEYTVDCTVSGDNIRSVVIDNKSYAVVVDRKDTVYDIERADDHFKVEILDEMRKFMKERVAKGLQGRQVIETHMPGLILKIFVEKGQEVKQGDPLMILVAMKMENEIKAPKDGVVQEIFVQESKTVGSGDKLIIIE